MRIFFLIAFLSISIGLASCAGFEAQEPKILSAKADTIFPKGDKATNGNFAGIAYLQMLVAADQLNPTDRECNF